MDLLVCARQAFSLFCFGIAVLMQVSCCKLDYIKDRMFSMRFTKNCFA